MKLLLSLAGFVVACSVSISSANVFAQSTQSTTTDDIAAITKTLNYYIEGGTNRDSATFAKAFMTDGQMIFMRNDTVRIVPLKDFVAGMKPGEKVNRSCRISGINVFGSAASAHIDLVYADFVLVDFMNLLKTKDGWKIVGKIFSREDRPKEQSAVQTKK
ncbi:MAG: nuclear transport factor 2 family protein [Candidatus Kapabacteria bacterium]|nr:nuclear transport factor 2 family protein [Candidatus Kapabacteria bacterium]